MIDFHPTTIPCYRCAASAWEAVRVRETRERGREDVVQCAFCGVMDSVPAVKVERTAGDEFRFQFGRFSGMTLAEADGEENGRAYLEHLRDTNEKLRDRIAAYLAENALDSSAMAGDIVPPSELSGAMDCPERVPSSQRLFG